MKIFGIITIILFVVCYVPQILKTYRLKTIKMSIWMWIIAVIAHLTGIIYVFYAIKDVILLVNYFCGLFMVLLILVGYIKFRNANNKGGLKG